MRPFTGRQIKRKHVKGCSKHVDVADALAYSVWNVRPHVDKYREHDKAHKSRQYTGNYGESRLFSKRRNRGLVRGFNKWFSELFVIVYHTHYDSYEDNKQA